MKTEIEKRRDIQMNNAWNRFDCTLYYEQKEAKQKEIVLRWEEKSIRKAFHVLKMWWNAHCLVLTAEYHRYKGDKNFSFISD